jgi:mono/diheme cytochrome c family protein
LNPRAISLIAALVFVSVLFCTAQQGKVKETTAPQTSAASGKEMFKAYCGSCHGVDGTGNGPAGDSLKAQPADLTRLAKNNGGKFPTAHVYEVINGRASTPAHGSADMPVWGPVFLRVSHSHDSEVQLRLNNLTEYIQSLQK